MAFATVSAESYSSAHISSSGRFFTLISLSGPFIKLGRPPVDRATARLIALRLSAVWSRELYRLVVDWNQ
jgi:hypothetical protein